MARMTSVATSLPSAVYFTKLSPPPPPPASGAFYLSDGSNRTALQGSVWRSRTSTGLHTVVPLDFCYCHQQNETFKE